MSRPADGLLGPGIASEKVLFFGLLSLGLHVLIILWLVLGPGMMNSVRSLEPIYTVDLVGDAGLPPPPPAAGPESVKAPKETAPTPAAKPKVEPPKPVEKVKAAEPAELIPVGKDETKPEPKVEPLAKLGTHKESSKLVAVKAEEEIDKALSRLEKKLAEKKEAAARESEADIESRHLEQALARTQKRVEAGAYGTGGGSNKGNSALAAYYTKVWQRVRSNWTLPEEWQKSKLEAIVIVQVRPDGTIFNSRFEKRSGHAKFDQSVARAIERSNPLPPLPRGLVGSDQEIGLRFRPEG